MADLIDREELLNIAQQQGYVTVDDILSAPTIDAVPVVHGRWISNNAKSAGRLRYTCSECHHVTGYKQVNVYDFCPHCGAKMDGGQDDG